MDVVTSRVSVREYLNKEVEEEKLTKVFEAARLAPSWANKQGCRYVVIKDKETISALASGFTSWLKEAPVVLVACIDPKDSGSHNGMDYYLVDVGISMQQLILAATNLGLGTCWIGGFEEEKVKNLLGIPDHVRVVAMTPLGYPTPINERSKTRRDFIKGSRRKTSEEIIHKEKL